MFSRHNPNRDTEQKKEQLSSDIQELAKRLERPLQAAIVASKEADLGCQVAQDTTYDRAYGIALDSFRSGALLRGKLLELCNNDLELMTEVLEVAATAAAQTCSEKRQSHSQGRAIQEERLTSILDEADPETLALINRISDRIMLDKGVNITFDTSAISQAEAFERHAQLEVIKTIATLQENNVSKDLTGYLQVHPGATLELRD